MKKVDFERSCASFNLCLSFLPVLCVRSLQVLWGNWLHNQTFPKLVAAQSGVKCVCVCGGVGGGRDGGLRQKKLDAEIFLYLDCLNRSNFISFLSSDNVAAKKDIQQQP